MTCPKCNFQNPEGTLVCQNCKTSLSRKKNVWKVGFFIEFFLLVLFVVLIVALTSDNMDLKLKVSTVVPQISQPSPAATVYPQITSWETYANPELGITFQYPSDWVIDDSYGSIWVYHRLENCERSLSNNCQYYSLYIERWDGQDGVQVNTADPAVYVLENLLKDEQQIEKCTVKTGTFCQGQVAIPGFPAYYGREYNLVEIYGDSKQTLFPAVEISTMPRAAGSLQYFVINNKRIYLIELAAPDFQAKAYNPSFTDGNHPIIKIIKTLKFL